MIKKILDSILSIKYVVNFNNGCGYESSLDLRDLISEINSCICYTKQSITIEDEDGNTVARLPFSSTRDYIEMFDVVADFGDFGYYGEWEIY